LPELTFKIVTNATAIGERVAGSQQRGSNNCPNSHNNKDTKGNNMGELQQH